MHMWPPMRAKVCQSDPKVAKMEPKWRPGTLPKVVLYADRVKNGTICDPYIGPFQNTSFLLHFCYPKVVKNRVLHRGRQKGLKSEVPGDTMTRHGVHMGPQGCPGEAQGSPKASQNSSKT